jgi:hypothetical protein
MITRTLSFVTNSSCWVLGHILIHTIERDKQIVNPLEISGAARLNLANLFSF